MQASDTTLAPEQGRLREFKGEVFEESINAKRIQCPYRGWVHGDDGRLLVAPFAPSGAVDKAVHCLPTYLRKT